MFSNRRRLIAGTAAVAMAAALAACGGGGSSGGSPSGPAKAGGTLHYYINDPYEYIDPQRAYLGVEMTNCSRTVFRSLVAFPISTDPKVNFTPVPDLATDTGTSSEGGKVWKFTLKDGIKWQDGKPITCEDFKYGASRAFATDVITGGPTYLLTYLDIPTDAKTGLPAYDGPYKGDGQDVLRQGGHLRRQDDHLPLQAAVAGLPPGDRFAAHGGSVPPGQGPGREVQLPDLLQRPLHDRRGDMWDKNTGATFVRNPNYDPKTDSTDIRKALPDKIDFSGRCRPPRRSTTA